MCDHNKVLDTKTILRMLDATRELNDAMHDVVQLVYERELERQPLLKPDKKLTIVK